MIDATTRVYNPGIPRRINRHTHSGSRHLRPVIVNPAIDVLPFIGHPSLTCSGSTNVNSGTRHRGPGSSGTRSRSRNRCSSLRPGVTAIRLPLLLLKGIRTSPCNSVIGAQGITHLLTTHKWNCSSYRCSSLRCHHQNFILGNRDFIAAPADVAAIKGGARLAHVHSALVVHTANGQPTSSLLSAHDGGGGDVGTRGRLPGCARRQRDGDFILRNGDFLAAPADVAAVEFAARLAGVHAVVRAVFRAAQKQRLAVRFLAGCDCGRRNIPAARRYPDNRGWGLCKCCD